MHATKHRALIALSLAALTSLAGCLDAEDADTGTVNINLTGQGDSGATYRLRDATITVAGPAPTVVWHTEDDPNRTSLSANVVTGAYTATVATGWRLEKVVTGQPPVTVVATLASPNPAMFTVLPMQRTSVPLRFVVDGSVVDMNQGYDIVIDVDDVVVPSIVTTVSALTLVEGGTAVIGVRLSAAPAAPLTIAVTSSDPTAAIAAPATLTFTPANFAVLQNVTVTGVQDADLANEALTLALASAGVPPVTVAVTVADDDVQAIITSVSSLSLVEGSTAVLNVRLAAQPPANVTVAVTSSDPGAVATTPTVLVFTPASYATPQNVVLTGVQDADLLDEAATVTLSAAGTPPRTVAVNVIDDDHP
jgi:hypothetical protein